MVPEQLPGIAACDDGDDMPTLPGHGYSGTEIKSYVIMAMSRQMAVERECLGALDKLLFALCIADSVPPPPRQQTGAPQSWPLDSGKH